MKFESMAAVSVGGTREASAGRLCALAALAAFALAPVAAHAAPAAAAAPGPTVRFEPVEGSSVKRVILSARAAQRLGIETSRVSEEAVVRKQMVGGLIIPPMDQQPPSKPAGGEFGGFARPASAAVTPAAAPVPAGGPVWVMVTLSPGEWERLAKDKPVRLLQLATREPTRREVLAQPSGLAPLEDIKRSMLSVYYTIAGLDHGLAVNNRVRVELPLAGSDDKQKIVPYSAVYYDAKGAAWVYVNAKPLTFERRRVSVERVVGNQAILSDGPPVGTPVVSVGAALLYGAEIFKK
jgi:hypothetical protein